MTCQGIYQKRLERGFAQNVLLGWMTCRSKMYHGTHVGWPVKDWKTLGMTTIVLPYSKFLEMIQGHMRSSEKTRFTSSSKQLVGIG